MSSPGGATVRIVFYVISQTGKPERWFTTGDVLRELALLETVSVHSRKLKALRNAKIHSGHSRPMAFDIEAKMRGWLQKHVDGKPKYWFEASGSRFRFKRQEIPLLKALVS